jgi:hypothetical protein
VAKPNQTFVADEVAGECVAGRRGAVDHQDAVAPACEELGRRGAGTTRADHDRVIDCLLTAMRALSQVV